MLIVPFHCDCGVLSKNASVESPSNHTGKKLIFTRKNIFFMTQKAFSSASFVHEKVILELKENMDSVMSVFSG